MKHLFLLITLLAISSVCCVLPGIGTSEPNATQTPYIIVANPTVVPPADTAVPATPDPCAAEQFFIDNFDGSSLCSTWSPFTVYDPTVSDLDRVTLAIQNGKLLWNFDSEYVLYYLLHEGHYTDVKVEVRAENRGKNNNAISLVCHYTPQVGWYEFRIANNGLYEITYTEVTADGKFGINKITNGGSTHIKTGKDVNEYAITCSGNKLSLTINGFEENTFTENKYVLREGGVGVAVSAFDVLPIQVEMDWVKVSQP